jgi:hypothetical protein
VDTTPTIEPMGDEFFTVKEVAEMFRVQPNAVYLR